MSTSLAVPAFLSKASRRNSTNSTSSNSSPTSSTLSEALRTNPFGTRSRSPLRGQDAGEEKRRKGLNDDLVTIGALFPDIKTEVIRELLQRFDGVSRLQVCVGQLLKHRAEWVKGRWSVPPRDVYAPIPLEETFRSEKYKVAVKTVLYQEYRALSKGAVDAVLAEGNFSYTYARPVLRDLSKKTWRATLISLNFFRKKKEIDEPPSFIFQPRNKDDHNLQLKETGSEELDAELAALFQTPMAVQRQNEQETQDRTLAETLNRQEAEEAKAIYECDCCYSETTFEFMSACTTNGHIICFDCIRHTIYEAIFGQGWGKSIDVEKSTITCLAALADEPCDGCLPPDLVFMAVRSSQSGLEIWRKFEERLANDALLKSEVKLVHCAFCSYAEADPLYQSADRPANIHWHFRTHQQFGPSALTILLLELLPLFLIVCFVLGIFFPALEPGNLFRTSLQHLSLKSRSPRFICRSPTCSRASCLRCLKPWHDPHICHEPLLISLRTAIEAARTAAVKRTCPRCGLSFVKSSGCNKLTCVCGYTMCYLCRKSLGADNRSQNGRAAAIVEGAQGEGYRHFCEHFRVNPGKPCDQCDKCDLYRAEDEDIVVRRAGEEAERAWRIKENMVGVEGFDNVNSDATAKSFEVGYIKWWNQFCRGEWDVQGIANWAAERVLVVEA